MKRLTIILVTMILLFTSCEPTDISNEIELIDKDEIENPRDKENS